MLPLCWQLHPFVSAAIYLALLFRLIRCGWYSIILTFKCLERADSSDMGHWRGDWIVDEHSKTIRCFVCEHNIWTRQRYLVGVPERSIGNILKKKLLWYCHNQYRWDNHKLHSLGCLWAQPQWSKAFNLRWGITIWVSLHLKSPIFYFFFFVEKSLLWKLYIKILWDQSPSQCP